MLTAAALLVVAVVFGGGGSRAGIANLVVQLTALVAIAFHREAFFSFFKEAPSVVAALVAITVLLPLLQLVPLPPAIWHQLPGRELAVEALALLGNENSWMAFSVNAQRTFIAFLALMPPLAILVVSWRASDRDRRFLFSVLLASAVAGIILGTQQLASGNRELVFYSQGVASQDLQGTFANRNTAGIFIEIALCALIGLAWGQRPSLQRVTLSAAAGAILVLGLFLTRSRSSMALIVVPAALLLILVWRTRDSWLRNRSRTIGMLGAISIVATSIGLLGTNTRVQNSLERFDTLQDVRPMIWEDTQSSIKRFWPLGSGIGTFDEVFQLDESLENLGPGRAARAHNDYLEATLESGVLGIGLIASWVVVLSLMAGHSLRTANDIGPRIAAVAAFLLIGFQSILDYPLRSQTILCLAGLMFGILIQCDRDHVRADVLDL